MSRTFASPCASTLASRIARARPRSARLPVVAWVIASRLSIASLTATTALPLGAQPAVGTGRVVGRIVDASTGAGLSDVGVQVVGTTLGTTSGVDGRYSVVGVPAGTVTIQVRRIGYQPKTVTGLMLPAGVALEQNVSLAPAAITLTPTVVTASAERGSVNAALDQQRRATQIVNSVTSEQIAKSPDADAAQAVQRVSGVTVQDGRYVFVRGLGERYTTASLNGTRLPSPEPERKVVPLDLFPSGLLQSVTTSKTFTPDQPGDFSGASVDIRTREFPARRQVLYSSSLGYNSAATGKSTLFAPGVGGEAFALAGSARDIPAGLAEAGNLGQATQEQQNQFINSFRNVWRAGTRTGTPNASFGLSVGGNDPVVGHRIGYVLSGTYTYTQEANLDQVRALARPGSGENAPPVEKDRFEGATYRNSTLWGGLFNLSTLIGTRTRLSLNNTYNRTADNEARVESGSLENYGTAVDLQRLDYVQRSVYSSQLAGEHDLGRQKIDWAGTLSGVTRDEPDRSELAYQRVADPTTGAESLLWYTDGEGAVRTFGSLSEHSLEGRANYQIRLGAPERPQTLKFGALGRHTSRDADARSYTIEAFGTMTEGQRALAPEQIFGGQFTKPGDAVLSLVALGQGGSYTAGDDLAAGYVMGDLGFSERLRFIGGARVEYAAVDVFATPTTGSPVRTTPTFTDVLPSAALNYKLTDLQNLRVSAARTLARPEYRELSPLTTRDVIGGELLRGNPNLVRTLIDNADIRWEWYPNAGEVLSAGAFYKHFHDPIERVYQSSSNVDILTFNNAEAGDDYGLELEARKNLGFAADWLRPVTVFTNATLLRSEVRLGAARLSSTNASRPMVGQAPYVLNGGVTYTSASGRTSGTVLYNRVGQRIVYAGSFPLPDVYEKPRDLLDVSLRFPLVLSELSGRVDARNLLDSRHLLMQGPVTRESYYTGRSFSFGVTWQP